MNNLTEEQYAALPLLNSHDRVFGLKAVIIHQGLKKSPVSIVASTGQYRLQPRLSIIAAKAFYAARDQGGYNGPCDGKLGDVLKLMRGSNDASSICSEAPVETDVAEAQGTPLEHLAAKLAREALADLQSLTTNAVESEYRKARGAVMQAALARLGELD